MKKYKPSNGSEGIIFTDKYCMNCLHCDPDPEGTKQCDILSATMVYDVKDKEYPKEWVYNENYEPKCTQWQEWDWGNDGDPDGPYNPELHTLLGVVIPPPHDVKNGDVTLNGNFYEKYARMHRALINWRKGVNGKIDIIVTDENKEWLLALNEETNYLIRYFDYVFGDND